MLGDEVYGNGCASGWNSTSGPMCWRSRRRCGRWSGGDPGAGQGSAEPLEGWRRLSAGAKGERLYDWARFRLFRLQQAPWDHWLLVRRKLSKPDEMAYYVVFGPAATSLEAGSPVGAGRSRSASRRPSRRSGWTATRCAAGTAGTGTSPYRCWRSPSWRRCGSNSPPKRGRKIQRIHCLQHARDPSPHHPLPGERRPLHRLHSRMVALASGPSDRRQSLPLETTDRQTPDLPVSSTVVLRARFESVRALRSPSHIPLLRHFRHYKTHELCCKFASMHAELTLSSHLH